MKVKELMELLAGCNAEATVTLMTQPGYPHEHSIAGLSTREECDARWCEEWGGTAPRYEEDTGPGDIILLEGAWLRYGNRAAWRATRLPFRL